MEQEVLKIEGISPSMLWTALYVIVGLCALVVLGDKVLDVFRHARQRKLSRN